MLDLRRVHRVYHDALRMRVGDIDRLHDIWLRAHATEFLSDEDAQLVFDTDTLLSFLKGEHGTRH